MAGEISTAQALAAQALAAQAVETRALAPKIRFLGTRAVAALMLREMATTYGRSPGGYLWAVLEPIAALTLLTFFFSLTFHAPPLGSNFALFYATGYLPFMLYSEVGVKISQSIRYSKPLLAYPPVTYIHAMLSRFVLNCLTHLVVFSLIIAGIVLLNGLPLNLSVPAIAQSFSMAMALAFGVGTLNCYLSSTFPIWERVWGIANRPLFLVSGIIFLIDDIGDTFRNILLYNPLVHVVAEMRVGFYPTYNGSLVSPGYVYSISIVCYFFGILLLHRYHKNILNDEG
jgi:capsular polysaccharide transport system permease protein